MKKIMTLIIMLLLITALFIGCSSDQSSTEVAADNESATEAEAETSVEVEPIGAFAEYPILVVSSGQSADVHMINTVMTQMGIEEFEMNPLATSADVEGIKTVIVAIGGSSKGLGAAGIEAEDEVVRTQELLDSLGDDVAIIGAHVGGESRRGTLSDMFADTVLPYCDYLMVVDGGDEDGFFTENASSLGLPMDIAENLMTVGDLIKGAMK